MAKSNQAGNIWRPPLFLILLPVFFVFHGYYENFPVVPFWDSLLLTAIFIGAGIVLYLLSCLLFRNSIAAGLLAFFMLSFYFFFGALHDFLRTHDIVLHRYSLLLPLFGLVTILLAVFLQKKKDFSRLPLFLHVLLSIYILVDGCGLALKAAGRSPSPVSSYTLAGTSALSCDTCARPDIYFLLFDGYNASQTLKDYYHYDNSGLDSFLRDEGFHIQRGSRSNYFATMFSMASMLNLSYLKDLKDPQKIRPDDFTNLFEPIRNNEVMRFLAARGYTIVNNSIFDLAGNPSTIDQPFIPTKTKLITDRTLINYLVRDMGKWFERHFLDRRSQGNKVYATNVQLLAQTIAESRKTAPMPRFVYTHLLMPHFPHLFDSLQHRRDPMVVGHEIEFLHPEPYLNYLPYTNARIRELIGAIKQNTGGKAVIIFMSDHGFRYYPKEGADERTFFHNQNAIYFPDHDYRGFYDSISAVNEFRVVFNKMFRQHLPLLKDSTIFLKVRE